MPARRFAAAFLALLACAAPARALELQLAADGLHDEEATQARAAMDEVARALPRHWADALGAVRVEWRDDLPADVHGRARGDRILLRRALLADADGHAARAALVHELAHLYDRSAAGGLSRDPRLLDLAGWQDAPLRPWRTRNRFTDRSPDLYELESPAEFVAVNLEYYLLDDSYPCRRPQLARHFDAAFGEPRAHAPCPPGLPFVQFDATATPSAPLLELDPARVYAVDYLLAEGNERPMSRWGHSMLRLVVCAPGRAPGPDCRLDLDWHLVLSFRAFVDDVQVSSWRGLTGSYPSRLFLLPLAQVVDEYTKVELRGLRSIPLRLHPEEVAMLLQRAARLHWSYDGRYYFIGNNCAVETARLLADGVPGLHAADLMSITPGGLLRRLDAAGVVDASVLDDRDRAIRLGYYFPPASARYQAMFDVARAALELPQRDVREWMALPAGDRAAVFEAAGLRASAALLLLEEAALRRLQLEARDVLKRHMPDVARDGAGGLLAIEDLLTRPAQLAPDGYGLPQPAERRAIGPEATALAARWQGQRDALFAQARGWLPAHRQAALEAVEGNVAVLGSRLRELHRAAGGLELSGH